MDMPDGSSAAFVGSHNLTGFALLGANGEAGILIEGPSDAPEFASLRRHIAACILQATQYDPAMKDAYAWWTTQFIDGLKVEVGREPSDAESKQTIVVMSARGTGALPRANNVIYFEMAKALMEFQSLRPEVHIYIFDQLPPSPATALSSLNSAKARLACGIEGIQTERGGVELITDFHIDNRRQPRAQGCVETLSPSTRCRDAAVQRPGPREHPDRLRVPLRSREGGLETDLRRRHGATPRQRGPSSHPARRVVATIERAVAPHKGSRKSRLSCQGSQPACHLGS